MSDQKMSREGQLTSMFENIGKAKEVTAKGINDQIEKDRAKKGGMFGSTNNTDFSGEDDLDELERKLTEEIDAARKGTPAPSKNKKNKKSQQAPAPQNPNPEPEGGVEPIPEPIPEPTLQPVQYTRIEAPVPEKPLEEADIIAHKDPIILNDTPINDDDDFEFLDIVSSDDDKGYLVISASRNYSGFIYAYALVSQHTGKAIHVQNAQVNSFDEAAFDGFISMMVAIKQKGSHATVVCMSGELYALLNPAITSPASEQGSSKKKVFHKTREVLKETKLSFAVEDIPKNIKNLIDANIDFMSE